MIPNCLHLDPRVREVIIKWQKTFTKLEDYEDVCCSSSFTFHVYATEIGDVLWVTRNKRKLSVGIDDENELYMSESCI